jgi:hypothetical protein
MSVFDCQTFLQFLGQPSCKCHAWGEERCYVVPETSLVTYETALRDTLYHHHSSFDLLEDLKDLGYPLTAAAMYERSSGNPHEHNTQMGNLGEIMGAEFGIFVLGFETTRVFPKWANPNVEQSMKGVDIIGLQKEGEPAELLVGEAKTYTEFDRKAVEKAYDHLVDLHSKDASQILHSLKESLRLSGDKEGTKNLDRHMVPGIPRHSTILLITQSAPQEPFKCMDVTYRNHLYCAPKTGHVLGVPYVTTGCAAMC